MKLYRVILPAGDLGRSVDYFSRVLDTPGERVSGERHYFDCGGVILACVVPESAGQARPNSDHLYFAVSDLEATYSRAEEAAAKGLGAITEGEMGDIAERPWGERSFYAHDPFGNPVCFVDERTLFTGGRFVP